jgi:hypothetical protein
MKKIVAIGEGGAGGDVFVVRSVESDGEAA